MKKEFLPYDTVRNNTLKLARRIYQDGFMPDVIYVSLRGGACLGNVISEYFKVIRRKSRPVYYAAVVARSYTDVLKQDKVTVEGWTYDPARLRIGDRVLLVDDIFDSGRTINHLAGIILEKGIPRQDLKV
ncbi:MAG: phosphoribosyltransferase, partial [Treponema sp.]|nr:phosphoribosyltransferase [Treponema sp.]